MLGILYGINSGSFCSSRSIYYNTAAVNPGAQPVIALKNPCWPGAEFV